MTATTLVFGPAPSLLHGTIGSRSTRPGEAGWHVTVDGRWLTCWNITPDRYLDELQSRVRAPDYQGGRGAGEGQMVPVRVEESRLAGLVERLGRVGAQPGGEIIRPMYSPAWRQAQDLVASFMREAGQQVREDAVGNVLGPRRATIAGTSSSPGSHVDTVTYGGAFDGAMGVLSAIAGVEAVLRVAGRARRTVEVVSLCEEEGSRFHANPLRHRGHARPARAG